jgi:hypothetical protein
MAVSATKAETDAKASGASAADSKKAGEKGKIH